MRGGVGGGGGGGGLMGSDNHLQQRGAAAIAGTLQSLPVLQTLDLRSCQRLSESCRPGLSRVRSELPAPLAGFPLLSLPAHDYEYFFGYRVIFEINAIESLAGPTLRAVC